MYVPPLALFETVEFRALNPLDKKSYSYAEEASASDAFACNIYVTTLLGFLDESSIVQP